MNELTKLAAAIAQEVAQAAEDRQRWPCPLPNEWWAVFGELAAFSESQLQHIEFCPRCQRTQQRFAKLQERRNAHPPDAVPAAAATSTVDPPWVERRIEQVEGPLTIAVRNTAAGQLLAEVLTPNLRLAGRTAWVEIVHQTGTLTARIVLETRGTEGCIGHYTFDPVPGLETGFEGGVHVRASLTEPAVKSATELPAPLPDPLRERAAMSPLHPGLKVNDFELVQRLGIGGFGEVWKARDTSLTRSMALKLLPRKLPGLTEKQTEDYVRWEAQRRIELRLHADVPILFLFQRYQCLPIPDAFGWVLVMEYIEGSTLEERLTRLRAQYCRDTDALLDQLVQGAVPGAPDGRVIDWGRVARSIDYQSYLCEHLEWVVRVVVSLAKTTRVLHDDRILHLDIKPANTLVAAEGEKAYLFDLGAGRLIGPAGQGTSGLPAFTRCYASPEQWRREEDLDVRSDVFSLGATLYHALCLFPPYAQAGPGGQVLCGRRSAEEEPVYVRQINPELDEHLAGIVRRAMAIDRAARYQSVGELLNALHDWLAAAAGNARGQTVSLPTTAEALRVVGTVLIERSHEASSRPAGVIPYGSSSHGELIDPYCLRLVQLGTLRMEPDGYRIPGLGQGDASTFLRRNGEEWIEKYGIGHLAYLLLADRGSGEIGVDAGSTTLWFLRALIFHDLAHHAVPDALYTSSLMGLAETINLGLRTNWHTFGGRRVGRTNALVNGVVDGIRAINRRLDAAVIGINALSTVGRSPGLLATSSGDEGPIKEFLIEQTLRELVVLLNPAKLGEEGARPLTEKANLPYLLQGHGPGVTIATAYPYRTSAEQPLAYSRRVVRFFKNLERFLDLWPDRWTVSLYGIPRYPERLRLVQGLADLLTDGAEGTRQMPLRERFVTFQRSLTEDMVLGVLLEYSPGEN